MGRRAKQPKILVAPVSSKRQLLGREAVCTFLGGISEDSLQRIRNEKAERFPSPLQMLGQTPMWSVEQLERWVGQKMKEVDQLTA